MKTLKVMIVVSIILSNGLILAQESKVADQVYTTENPLVLMDFDGRQPVTLLGGMWGVFDFNPTDRNAYCRSSFSRDKDLHNKGYYLKLSYDVDSPQAAFNGIWVKLNGMDLSDFDAVAMKVRGDKEAGYSDFFKIELKDKATKIEYYIEDITDQWKEYVIPFADFLGTIEDMNWKNMNEFIPCVFEDWRFKQKTGRIYLDDIRFIPKKGKKVNHKDILYDPKREKQS